MTNDGQINATNTEDNVTQDAADKKGYGKKKNVTDKNQEMSLEVEPNEGITSQEPSTSEANEDDVEVLPNEEIESIQSDLDGHTLTEIETRQTIATLECRLIEALNTIDAMKAKIEALEVQVNIGMIESARNVIVMREAKIEAPKPPVDDDAKINTAVLNLSETIMLWWRRKSVDAERGLCTISTWDQLKDELKQQFFPNNILYEARRKL
ncbi:hypothetical protein KY285_005187 [Solanum tuberosum]|nr:hypothetical protein KY284_005416 [Solanum tuberosum]KAH0752039.1 hypothetical protein KY285_005187 [Solanum tuberosum]